MTVLYQMLTTNLTNKNIKIRFVEIRYAETSQDT